MPKVNLCVDLHVVKAVEEVSNKQKRIIILFDDSIKSIKIYTEMKRTIFLLDKEDRSFMQRSRLPNESGSEILVNEPLKSKKLS